MPFRLRLKIGGRLYALVALFAVGCGMLSAGLIWLQNSRAMDARQRELGALIDVAIGALDVHRKLAEAGSVTEEDAKKRAFAVIAGMRYGNGDYIYIVDREFHMLMHPTAPQLIGKPQIDLKDATGFLFHREMARQVEANRIARVSYYWQKPGSEAVIRKTSVAKAYNPWNLRVVTGVYDDDLLAELYATIVQAGSVTVTLVLVLGVVAFWLARSIVRPIGALVSDADRLAAGDTSVEFKTAERHDEVGTVARAVAKFRNTVIEVERMSAEKAEQEQRAAVDRKAGMHKLAQEFEAAVGNIVETVSSSATELEAAASTLRHTAETTQQLSGAVASASEQASTNVQSVASATDELTASVHEISRQVHESNKIANEAVRQAETTDARINELSNAASRIGDVVKLITAIAEQTNLLALNATIEAARAGEAGRGFAVVASEVKSLANQTAKATEEISSHIAGMQTATKDSVTAIKEIGTTIGHISDITSAIAAAVEEQGAATQEISRNIQEAAKGTSHVAANIADVNEGASETGSASSQVLVSAQALSGEGNRLKIEVGKFLATVRAA
jgi:methyl-accepting chemotaxis protein